MVARVYAYNVYSLHMAARKAKVKKVITSKTRSKVAMKDMDIMEVSPVSSFDSSKVKSVSTKTKAALVVAFIIIVFALYKGKGYFVAATVNNQPISRLQVVSELEKRSGKQALDSLISQALIKQEAKKKGVSISSTDIDAEVSKIEESVKSQNQDLDNLLSMQGMTKADLRDQIETQKLVEKIFGSEIDPTTQEIDDYIKQNKDSFPKETSSEDIKKQVTDQLKQQKLSEKFQSWIAEIKSNANIKYFVNY